MCAQNCYRPCVGARIDSKGAGQGLKPKVHSRVGLTYVAQREQQAEGCVGCRSPALDLPKGHSVQRSFKSDISAAIGFQ